MQISDVTVKIFHQRVAYKSPQLGIKKQILYNSNSVNTSFSKLYVKLPQNILSKVEKTLTLTLKSQFSKNYTRKKRHVGHKKIVVL